MRRFLSPLRLAPLSLATAQLLTAVVVQALLTPLLDWHSPRLSVQVALSVVLLGLFSTGLAYVLYFRLIGDIGATSASAVNYLVPVFAVLIGVALLGEPVTWNLLAGGVVALTGVAFAENRLRRTGRGRSTRRPRAT